MINGSGERIIARNQSFDASEPDPRAWMTDNNHTVSVARCNFRHLRAPIRRRR